MSDRFHLSSKCQISRAGLYKDDFWAPRPWEEWYKLEKSIFILLNGCVHFFARLKCLLEFSLPLCISNAFFWSNAKIGRFWWRNLSCKSVQVRPGLWGNLYDPPEWGKECSLGSHSLLIQPPSHLQEKLQELKKRSAVCLQKSAVYLLSHDYAHIFALQSCLL